MNAATPAITLTFPGPGSYWLMLSQDAVGGRVPTWVITGGGGVYSPGGPPLVLSVAPNAIDLIRLDVTGGAGAGVLFTPTLNYKDS